MGRPARRPAETTPFLPSLPLDALTLVLPFLSQLRYHEFLNKRHLVNPKKSGPFHHRAPSRIFYRAIRGMVPHKVRYAPSSEQRRRGNEARGGFETRQLMKGELTKWGFFLPFLVNRVLAVPPLSSA
jgi:hypothetical protein